MSDLRERLVRRSERFHLEPGALDRVFDRRDKFRRRRRLAAAALALTLGVAGTLVVVSAFRGSAQLPADHSSTSPATLPAISDGVYWTPSVTRAELIAAMTAAGFSRSDAKKYYFEALSIPFDGSIRQGLVIQDGFWFQTARNTAGEEEAGWGGSFVVTGPHTVQASDNVCTITYRYSISGDSLTLHVLRDVGEDAECRTADLAAQTAIFDPAPFVRGSSLPSPTAG